MLKIKIKIHKPFDSVLFWEWEHPSDFPHITSVSTIPHPHWSFMANNIYIKRERLFLFDFCRYSTFFVLVI